MASYEPAIAHVFGISPPDQYELTAHQWLRLKDYLDQLNKRR